MITIDQDRILQIWDWCRETYILHGIKLSFPKNTEPCRTYQWRYLEAISKKFREWEFDDETAKKFISIAVAETKRLGVLNKGLASLHQNGILKKCYDKLTAQCNTIDYQIDSLSNMRDWFDRQIGDNEPLSQLLYRKNRRSLPNLIVWYKALKLSETFLALSKVCGKAVASIQDEAERRMLPSKSSLYLTRVQLTSNCDCSRIAAIFGDDWRK